jgi:hypothetical protein
VTLPSGTDLGPGTSFVMRTGGAQVAISCPGWTSGASIPVVAQPDVTTLFDATVVATGTGGRAVAFLDVPLAAGVAATITVPQAPDVAVPATTAWPPTVTWTAHAPGLARISLGTNVATMLEVFTADATVAVPDLSPLGLGVASGTAMFATATSMVDVTTVDDAASAKGAWAILRGTQALGTGVAFTTK